MDGERSGIEHRAVSRHPHTDGSSQPAAHDKKIMAVRCHAVTVACAEVERVARHQQRTASGVDEHQRVRVTRIEKVFRRHDQEVFAVTGDGGRPWELTVCRRRNADGTPCLKEYRDRSLCSCRDCQRDTDEGQETENLRSVSWIA